MLAVWLSPLWIAMLSDWFRHRIVHRVYVFGALLLIALRYRQVIRDFGGVESLPPLAGRAFRLMERPPPITPASPRPIARTRQTTAGISCRREKRHPPALVVLQPVAWGFDFDQAIAPLLWPELDQIRKSAGIVLEILEQPFEARLQVRGGNASKGQRRSRGVSRPQRTKCVWIPAFAR